MLVFVDRERKLKMKVSALLLCMGLLLPMMSFAQEAAPVAPAPEAPVEVKANRPAPTPEQREAFRKRMAERRQRMMCKNADCPCAKVMNERPTPPEKRPSEMTPEEREAFRAEMKAKMEARRKAMEEARAACSCEECICKRRPRGPQGPRGPRGPKPPRGPKGAPAPAAPAPEAAPAA